MDILKWVCIASLFLNALRSALRVLKDGLRLKNELSLEKNPTFLIGYTRLLA